MKKSGIIGVFIVAITIGVIIVVLNFGAKTGQFKQAIENEGGKYTISGQLNMNKPIVFNPSQPNITEFFMKDNEGQECKVILNKEKPEGFERSESLVVTGRMEGNTFMATDLLMKCPSKYNETKHVSNK